MSHIPTRRCLCWRTGCPIGTKRSAGPCRAQRVTMGTWGPRPWVVPCCCRHPMEQRRPLYGNRTCSSLSCLWILLLRVWMRVWMWMWVWRAWLSDGILLETLTTESLFGGWLCHVLSFWRLVGWFVTDESDWEKVGERRPKSRGEKSCWEKFPLSIMVRQRQHGHHWQRQM